MSPFGSVHGQCRGRAGGRGGHPLAITLAFWAWSAAEAMWLVRMDVAASTAAWQAGAWEASLTQVIRSAHGSHCPPRQTNAVPPSLENVAFHPPSRT